MLKAAVWLAGLIPLALALRQALGGGFADQAQAVAHLGTWGLRFLVAVLAVGPVAAWLRRPGLLALRRELGLIGFVYAAAHVAACIVFSGAWRWPLEAVRQRPDYIPGAAALILLVLAAIAAFAPVRRRLGERRWKTVQACTLLVAPLTVVHYAMPTGLEVLTPYLYGLAVVALLGWRAARGVLASRRPAASIEDRP